ncbi:MAG: peptidylprolyl isomerase [Chlorobiota bacterium]|jgi:peptidyl-prolyl cis-trans isomerase SurA|nr:peptidylprolyl isomerase [Chlorobiota bacterium]
MWRQVGILGVVGTLLWAQLPVREGEALDRVVAIVGGEAVFASDVEAQRQLLRQQFPQLQLPDSVLWQRALEALVDEKLMLLQAQEDSIVVSDDEVMQRLEFQLQLLVQQFGSERRVEQLYGMPLEQIRREYREEVRKRLLVEKLQQRRFGNVECSAREVEQFFQQYRDSLPPVPAQVELAHLVRYVRPDSLQRSRTLELALRLRDSLLKGADFAELARRYSGDAASAAHGGELGWIERGKLLPEYERAAFGLQIGEISAPVETPMGYYLIQVLDRRQDAVRVRHILLRMQGDAERVRAELEQLRQRVLAGEPFDSLALRYSEEEDTRGVGGSLGLVALETLPGELRTLVESLPDGGVSAPVPYLADPTRPALQLVYRKRLIPEHPAQLPEDFAILQRMCRQWKREQLYRQWIGQLRQRFPWQLRP